MSDAAHADECEFCAQPVGVRRVIEKPAPVEVDQLKKFFWVNDPERLVFCDEGCRRKWHGLRLHTTWLTHPDFCMCVECMAR